MTVSNLSSVLASLWLHLSGPPAVTHNTITEALLDANVLPIEKPLLCTGTCTTSEDGVSLIAYFEGYSPVVYKDAAGYPTIGYGHLIKAGESFSYLDPEAARKLLKKDVKLHADPVNRMVRIPLLQEQFDAIVSFTFNLGEGALRSSTLLKRVNARRHVDVPQELRKWVFAGGRKLRGLVIRRNAEAVMYSGDTDILLERIFAD
jgi:lysozyme